MTSESVIEPAPTAIPVPRTLLLLSWAAILVGSSLPEIAFAQRFAVPLLHWISLGRISFLIVLWWVTIKYPKLLALRPLLWVLLSLHLATGLFGQLVASPAWKYWTSGIDHVFVSIILDVQVVRVGVAAVLLLVLFVVYRARSQLYLEFGDMRATASPTGWLGISGKGRWSQLGLVLTSLLSVGSLLFLGAMMHPGIRALMGSITLLPFILLFSVTNALGEEISYRVAILVPTLGTIGSRHATLMSSVYFGIGHYYGIPSGLLGVVMAAFLGFLACKAILDTKGLGWAFVMHFVQDVWIFWFLAAMLSPSSK